MRLKNMKDTTKHGDKMMASIWIDEVTWKRFVKMCHNLGQSGMEVGGEILEKYLGGEKRGRPKKKVG